MANHFIEPEYRFEKLFGIPLSPSILEQAGFKEVYKSDYSHIFDLAINPKFGAGWDLNKEWFYVRYIGEKIGIITHLHQLQNLYYSLTGEDLTLNLCTPTNPQEQQ